MDAIFWYTVIARDTINDSLKSPYYQDATLDTIIGLLNKDFPRLGLI